MSDAAARAVYNMRLGWRINALLRRRAGERGPTAAPALLPGSPTDGSNAE